MGRIHTTYIDMPADAALLTACTSIPASQRRRLNRQRRAHSGLRATRAHGGR
jgi:hypothetical protein